MVAISKSKFKEFLKRKLQEDDVWAKQALLVIYRNQTPVEQDSEHTIEHNNIGFSSHDAEFLTSLAKQLEKKDYLSYGQMIQLKKQIHKYWRQILEASDRKKLTIWYYRENPDEEQLTLFSKSKVKL